MMYLVSFFDWLAQHMQQIRTHMKLTDWTDFLMTLEACKYFYFYPLVFDFFIHDLFINFCLILLIKLQLIAPLHKI